MAQTKVLGFSLAMLLLIGGSLWLVIRFPRQYKATRSLSDLAVMKTDELRNGYPGELVGNLSELRESESELDQDGATARKSGHTQATPSLFPQPGFPEPVFDFGNADMGDKIIHTFPIVNRGTAPLRIKHIEASCGCTLARLPQDVIPPQGRVMLEVEFDTDGKLGKQKKEVQVFTNARKKAYTLALTGYVYPPQKESAQPDSLLSGT
ncbi:MAG: DUF1573 domain-containing protein [Bacteroidota bacterium]